MALAVLWGGSVNAATRVPENQTEAVFRQARLYTVRIRTRVETPLAGDEQGSFSGAGFLIDAERGWIVTNAHVAGHGPSQIEVAFAGEAYRPARKLYVDSFADIAVLTLDHKVTHPAARLAGPEPAPVGEAIGAYGHPLGIPFTGTRGIVSGQTDMLGPNLTQIDATVDHGNSGGPVILLRTGEVMGIATLRFSDDQRDRLNFATPIADVHRIVAILRRGGSPRPPRLAFSLLMDEDSRMTMRVGETLDARRWPFQIGDSIVAVTGITAHIKSLDDLVGALRGRTDAVHLTVLRAGQPADVVVTPELRADLLDRRGISIDGARISPLEFDDQAVIPGRSTLLIHSVEPGSVASIRGLEAGDYVHEIDGRRFDSLDSLIAHVRSRAGHPLTVVVRRSSPDSYRVFDYHLRELPGDDIKLIGPEGATTASN
jgi:S1-C subfamily serine protease